MMNELLKSVVWTQPQSATAGFITITGAPGVVAEFHPFAPVRILKWGFLATTAVASAAANAQLSLLQRTAPGVSAGQVTVDTLTTGTTTYAVGTGAYRTPFTASTISSSPPSQLNTAGPLGITTLNNEEAGQQQLTLSAGQALAINVVTSPDATGAVMLFIEYVLLPISKPSGYGFPSNIDPDFASQAGSVSLTDNLTALAS
jgi:hypothetical protein